MLNYLENLYRQYKFPLFIWGICYLTFIVFIFTFSYLYPYSADEFFLTYKCSDFTAVIKEYLFSYMHSNSRIGLLVNNIILLSGKWLFLILNPIMQTILITLIISLIKGKKPDFTSLNDIPLFMITAIMSIFVIPKPDNTLFWIGGATNYSWSFIPFLLFLLFFKYVYEKQTIPPITTPCLCLLFVACIITNMCNENNSIAALIILALLILYSVKRNFKNKYVLYVMFSGLIIGTVLLFSAPGPYERLSNPIISGWRNASIFQKIIWHFPKIHELFIYMYCLPLITFVFLFLETYSTKLKSLKNNDFFFSIFAFVTASFLSAVLAGAPIFSSYRAFYSAAIMYIISFLYMIKYFSEYYRLRLMYYSALITFIFFVVILPFFSLPYIHLYKQDKIRNEYIAKVKTQNKKGAYLWFLYTIESPINNYELDYFDILLDKRANKILGLKVEIINQRNNTIGIL